MALSFIQSRHLYQNVVASIRRKSCPTVNHFCSCAVTVTKFTSSSRIRTRPFTSLINTNSNNLLFRYGEDMGEVRIWKNSSFRLLSSSSLTSLSSSFSAVPRSISPNHSFITQTSRKIGDYQHLHHENARKTGARFGAIERANNKSSGNKSWKKYIQNPARKRRLIQQEKEQHARMRILQQKQKHKELLDAERTSSGKLYPVSAIHIAQKIDLFPVISTLFARDYIKKQTFNKNSFVVQLPNDGGGRGSSTSSQPQQHPRYVAVFKFGSVVCFNCSPRYVATLVNNIKKHSTDPVLQGFERKENFGVLVRPPGTQDENNIAVGESSNDSHHLKAATNMSSTENDAVSTTSVTGDYCIVPELEINCVSVISNIMAQTVALDTYNDIVDDVLSEFFKINQDVTKTGKFRASDRDFLYKTVAQNNMIFVDMISKIRIKDRSDTAWNQTQYEPIHYQMKDEFEIDDRFDQIEFKLNLIQQNAKFFLEVLQSQKSNSLEWIIVVLIAVECVIMVLDMSGVGEGLMLALLEMMKLVPTTPK